MGNAAAVDKWIVREVHSALFRDTYRSQTGPQLGCEKAKTKGN